MEQAGKKVSPGNIAYYAILHTKSGRRSQRPAANTTITARAPPARNSNVPSIEKPSALPRVKAEASASSGTNARS